MLKLILFIVSFSVLVGCATVKDDDYMKAMERQDEEAFQRHMDIR